MISWLTTDKLANLWSANKPMISWLTYESWQTNDQLKKLMMSGLTDTSWQTNDHLIQLMISSLKDNKLANKWSAINAQISDWWSADIWQPDDNYQLTIAVKTSWWSYSMTLDHWPANKNIKHIKQAFDQLTNSWLTNKQINKLPS